MDTLSLNSTDERDKAYGIVGMALTLVTSGNEQLISAIALDDADGCHIHMVPDFGFSQNPRMSAKIIWAQSIKDLRAVTSMVLGNIACRRQLLKSRPIERETLVLLEDLVREQATEYCALDKDEAELLFDSCHRYVRRLFDSVGMQRVARSFCDRIVERRNMSAVEVVEYLASLGLR